MVLQVESSADQPSTSQRVRNTTANEPQFQWSSESATPEVPLFDDFQSGFNFGMSEDITEINVFQYFVDNELISMVVQMTNIFHNYFLLNVDLRMHSRLQRWYDVTAAEMYIFLAIMMLMTRNRHLSIEEHWSSDILLQAPIFSKLMSRNRFCMILGMLHFSIRSEENELLSKVTKFVNHARQKFKSCITPYKNLCIDESIVPFKGRLSIKQYLPNKRNRFGIKLFVLCDVATGFIVDFIVYCGASTDIVDPCNLGVGGAVVHSLLEDFFGSNRHLYVDNWYSSPALFKYLHEHGIFACGTVNKKRKGMPVLNSRLQLHEVEVKYSTPLMSLKWKDKKYLYMLSTIHDSGMGPSMRVNRSTGLPVMKPNAVLDYAKNMGSVDTADMLLSSIQCIRKTIKWYKKMFFHIFDMHLLNSFYCYKTHKNTPNLKFSQFQLSVIRQIIERYHSNANDILVRPSSIARSSSDNPLRKLTGNSAKHMPSQMAKYQRCKQCSIKKERKHTRFTCKICNVYLCAAPCFEQYHS